MVAPAICSAPPPDERAVFELCRAAPWPLISKDWSFLRRLHGQAEPFSPEDKARLAAIWRHITENRSRPA